MGVGVVTGGAIVVVEAVVVLVVVADVVVVVVVVATDAELKRFLLHAEPTAETKQQDFGHIPWQSIHNNVWLL